MFESGAGDGVAWGMRREGGAVETRVSTGGAGLLGVERASRGGTEVLVGEEVDVGESVREVEAVG